MTPDSSRPVRVVIAKAGMDGHDRGAKVVARLLRDAGFEVIYTGLYQTPEAIVMAAMQEDADAIGISVLSAAHRHVFGETARIMKEQGLDDVVLFGSQGDERITAEEWGDRLGTIGYEVVCGIGPRVPRVYRPRLRRDCDR